MRRLYRSILYIIIIIIFVGLGILINSYVRPYDNFGVSSCDKSGVTGPCIEVEMKTSVDNKSESISEFHFPYYLRRGDFLWIDTITIRKKNDDRSIEGSRLKFNIMPTEGHLEEVYSKNYGEFNIEIQRDVGEEDIYVIKKEPGTRKYYHYLNGEKIYGGVHWIIELYRIGEWYISFDFESEEIGGWTGLINGKWKGNVFYVHPRYEIENARIMDRSVVIALWAFLAMICFFILNKLHKNR